MWYERQKWINLNTKHNNDTKIPCKFTKFSIKYRDYTETCKNLLQEQIISKMFKCDWTGIWHKNIFNFKQQRRYLIEGISIKNLCLHRSMSSRWRTLDLIECIVLVSVCGLVEWPMVVFEVTLLDFLPGRVLLLNTLFIFEVTLLHFDYRPGRPLFKSLYYILILKSLY